MWLMGTIFDGAPMSHRPEGRRPRVLVALGKDTADRIAAAVPEVDVVAVPDGDQPLPPDVTGDVLFALPWETPRLHELLDRGVGWLHAASTGVDALPLDQLGDRLVSCSRGATAVPIAEFVLAVMLAFEKQLPDTWVHEPPAYWGLAELGGLEGRELGLIGLGTIGTEVARRATAFGMRVRAVRRTNAPTPVPGVEMVGARADLLPTADHLVIAAPATAATRYLIDAEALAQVKPGVHLVNVARGSLVDQDALLAALDDGRVAGASLDVAEPEPLPEGHVLYRHPKVRLSPHVSWASPGVLARIVDLFIADLRHWLAGEPLAGEVDLEAGY